jgi:GT2 family glycosyltransferase
VNGLTVVIPSRNAANLDACVASVLQNDACDIVVAWDRSRGNGWLPRGRGYRVRDVETDFVYARNCNIGIDAADSSDVILLNDDALLATPAGFTAMQEQAQAHPEYGVIAAATNVAGQALQKPMGQGLREVPRMVCFVCVLIPRRTIDLVGKLDEEFVGYGYEDDAYCLRVRRAGLKVGVFDGCFVDHGSLKSTFRGDTYPHAGFEQNRRIFVGKYGSHPL